MSIHYRQQGSAIVVLGNTYPYRDQLKALGARFNGSDKSWRVPASPANLRAVAELCTSTGGTELKTLATGGTAETIGLPVTSATRFVPSGLDLDMRLDKHELASELGLNLGQAGAAANTNPFDLDASFGSREPSTPRTIEARAGTDLDWAKGMGPPTRPASEIPSLSIRQLMERAEQAINSAFPAAVWVTGEVQNLAVKASGVFFDLAEGRAGGHANATVTVRAIIWKATLGLIRARRGADKLNDVLQDGMQLRCLCQVQLYKDRGSLSILVTDIDPSFSKGALALAREKLLAELRRKGLDKAQKLLQLPPFPLRLGLISADGSRAKSDFLDQLASLNYPGTVVFCSAVMQGEDVPRQVIQAMRQLTSAGCDLIVITRGGGSAADLRWFDAPEIAYAIAGATVPIIAAIGHHEDVCVAEEICFLRQKTPTAAADFIVATCTATRAQIDGHAAQLAKLLARRIEDFTWQTAALGEKLAAAGLRALGQREANLLQSGHQLQRLATARTHTQEQTLHQAQTQISRASERALVTASKTLAAASAQLGHAADRPLSGAATRLATLTTQLSHSADRPVASAAAKLAALQTQIDHAADRPWQAAATKLAALTTQLGFAAERSVANAATALQSLAAQLGSLDPSSWLAQGWTQLSGAGGRISSLAQATPGETVKARLRDGVLLLSVLAKESRQPAGAVPAPAPEQTAVKPTKRRPIT